MTMYKFLVLCLLVHIAWAELACPTKPAGLHKDKPSPEELKGCKQYSCNSCCTADAAKELAINPLNSVGRWNFTQCNRTLSTACSDTFSEILCFFKCSPNLYIFENKEEGFFRKIPLCSWFCDRWFTTCMNDMTCVLDDNWITGFKKTDGGVDQCYSAAKCRNYTQVYGGDLDKPGKQMCDQLFGSSFEYSEDKDKCLDPFTESHNVEIINEFFNNTKETSVCKEEVYTNYTDAGKIVGIVFGVLGGIFIILAGLAFYRRKKESKSKNIKKAEQGTAQELATMNAPTAAPMPATVPKDDSSSDNE